MRTLWLILCIWLVSASAAAGQSKAYAKFNAKGSTVGLYNLLAETKGCEEGRVISGTITKVTYDVGESSYSYTFTIETNGNGVRSTSGLAMERACGRMLRTSLCHVAGYAFARDPVETQKVGRLKKSDVCDVAQTIRGLTPHESVKRGSI